VDDDGCNMGTTYAQVLRQIDPRTIVVKETGIPIRAGDTIALWDWLLKKQRSEAKLVQFAREDDRSLRLTLDADVQVLHPVGSPGLPQRSTWKGGGRFEEFDGVDRIADFEAAGKMIVSWCAFRNAVSSAKVPPAAVWGCAASRSAAAREAWTELALMIGALR